jgi:PAS domain S-box-containing protein
LPVVPDEKQDEVQHLIQRALSGESLSNLETRRLRRDGTPVDLLLSTAPLYDDQGRVLGFVAVASDITDWKRLESQFLRTQRMESL